MTDYEIEIKDELNGRAYHDAFRNIHVYSFNKEDVLVNFNVNGGCQLYKRYVYYLDGILQQFQIGKSSVKKRKYVDIYYNFDYKRIKQTEISLKKGIHNIRREFFD
jgi:hypothetical protein